MNEALMYIDIFLYLYTVSTMCHSKWILKHPRRRHSTAHEKTAAQMWFNFQYHQTSSPFFLPSLWDNADKSNKSSAATNKFFMNSGPEISAFKWQDNIVQHVFTIQMFPTIFFLHDSWDMLLRFLAWLHLYYTQMDDIVYIYLFL